VPSRDPVRQPTTAQDAVRDLRTLLRAAKQPGPYVLVGHSFGGLVSRLFASAYPGEVSGIVLVDGASEAFQSALVRAKAYDTETNSLHIRMTAASRRKKVVTFS
jgi:pimeloyl-ACP methyl ester carboxylesterase